MPGPRHDPRKEALRGTKTVHEEAERRCRRGANGLHDFSRAPGRNRTDVQKARWLRKSLRLIGA
jgi:hypothetical protein